MEKKYIRLIDLSYLEDIPKRRVNKKIEEAFKQSQGINEIVPKIDEDKSENSKDFLDQEKNSKTNFDQYNEIFYIPNFKIDKYPEYPAKAKRLGYEGEIILKIITNNQGEILQIIIIKSTGYDILDKSAIDAVKTWNFKRAIQINSEKNIFKTKISFKLE